MCGDLTVLLSPLSLVVRGFFFGELVPFVDFAERLLSVGITIESGTRIFL